jgi:Ca2+-binding RTX toxin-like protein
MAIFTGSVSGGNDLAIAQEPIALVGFTGGSLGLLVDGIGDQFFGGDGNDTVISGSGNDTIQGGTGNDSINGAGGNDSIQGGFGTDSINGGAGNDTIAVLEGEFIDHVDGGADADTLDLSNITSYGAVINLTGGTWDLSSSFGGPATIVNIEKIIGTSLGDSITGSDAGEIFEGGNGNDTLYGGGGIDTILGGTGNDSIRGGFYTDSINGGAGNDTIAVLEGEFIDHVDGGADADTLDLSNITSYGAVINLTGDTWDLSPSFGGPATIVGVETIIGTQNTDSISGGSSAETINGGLGNDTLLGGGSSDSIVGGAGNDIVIWNSGHGSDTVDGGADADVVQVNGAGASGDIFSISASAGHVALARTNLTPATLDIVGSEILDVNGDGGNDSITVTTPGLAALILLDLDGGTGNDSIDGGDGNDFLTGGSDLDTLNGGDGNDLLIGDSLNNAGITFGGGIFNRALNTANGNLGAALDVSTSTNLYSLAANSDIAGSILIPHLSVVSPVGDAANITHFYKVSVAAGQTLFFDIDNVTGLDSMIRLYDPTGAVLAVSDDSSHTLGAGGSGSLDSFIAHTALVSGNYTVEVGSFPGVAPIATDGGYTLNISIANQSGSGADALNGGAGSDTLLGSAGNDTLTSAGAGTDVLMGGDGNDQFVFSGNYEEIVDGGAGVDRIRVVDADASFRHVFSVEEFHLAGTAIVRLGFEDLGLNPHLISDGGGIANTFEINANGANNFSVSGFTFTNWDANDKINIVGSGSITGSSGQDSIQGGGDADTLSGGAGNDTLVGGNGNDSINGAGGNDSIDGGEGDDTLNGSTGDDSLNGGNGVDWAYYNGAGSAVNVDLSIIGAQNTGGGGVDTLATIENVLGSNFNDSIAGNDTGNVITGGNGDDSLVGGDGDDTLIGGAGNDTLDGGLGFDSLVGGAGDDRYFVDNGSDVVDDTGGGYDIIYTADSMSMPDNIEEVNYIGSSEGGVSGNALSNLMVGSSFLRTTLFGAGGNDTLFGGSNDDILDGGLGDDIINGGGGIDSMGGGDGNDLYYVDDESDEVTENDNGPSALLALFAAGSLDGFIDTVIAAVNYTLTTFVENLTLTDSATTGTGNELDNIIIGNALDNILSGLDGDDTIDGGAGADIAIYSGNAADYLVSASGDVITVVDINAGNGDEGTDTVSGIEIIQFSDRDTIVGDSGNNDLLGGNGADSLSGNGGNDTLTGGEGDDTLNGGTGTDTASYAGAASAVTVTLASTSAQNTGGAGSDTLSNLENLTGSSYNDTLIGGTAANLLKGELGHDNLNGGLGNDTLEGSDGDDTLTGSTGDDSLIGGTGLDWAYYNGAGSAVTVNLTITTAQNTGGAGADTLNTIEHVLGSNYNDTLTGNSAANQLDGGAGNDTIDGGSGNDTMKGGSGNDLYIVAQSGDVVIESAGAGTDTVQSGITHTLATNVDHLILTGSGNATGNGNSLANSLTGNSGNNTLNGGTGNDTMAGGLGNDTYVVNAAGDVVTEALNQGADLVQASTSYTLAANVENLTLTGAGNSSGNGNILNNILTGNSKNNALNGGTGNDTMIGGAGNDTYSVNAAGDVVTEGAGAGTDNVNASINYTLGANVEHLTLTGSANTSGTGNTQNNKLTGNSGNNTLIGNGGADTLTGGGGADTLTGGTGVDRFDYNALTDAGDTITDFTAGAGGDKLDIDTLLTVLGYGGTNPITAGYVQLLQAGAHTLVQIDSNGGGDNFATTLVTLQNVTAGNVTLADNFII